MKIGIITFHRAYNYGALLQCYALSKYLSNQGYEVEVVDYYPSYFRKSYSLRVPELENKKGIRNKVATLVEYVLTLGTKSKRYAAFKQFYDYIPLSAKQYDESTLDLSSYDIVIWGSDQVWNPRLTQNDKNFVASIRKRKEQKFMSYAASTILYDGANEKDFYMNVLGNYDIVSVREKSLNDYLNNLVKSSSTHVLDPVFLLNKDQWKEIAKTPVNKRGYVLLYTVPTHPRISEITYKIAKEKGLDVIELAANVKMKSNFNCDFQASPQEFLGYFLNADFIVTTSFHGTAFSIILRKQFVTLLLDSVVDERATSLLSTFGLECRAVGINDELPSVIENIDYGDFDGHIESQCNRSKSYLELVIE